MAEASLTIREAVDAARAIQPSTNAFIEILDVTDGSDQGVLAGLPVAVKDNIDQQGHVTTAGSAFYRRRAESTAPAIARLEAAGATVIARTNLHEFALDFSSENPHFGAVRNPWDPATSAGGSSGGSAVSVATGVTPLAIGTDTGGSIRVPAALCGCFGFKPSWGLVPTEGVVPVAPSIDTVGPLSDRMELLHRAFRTMATTNAPTPTVPGRIRFGVPTEWTEGAPLEPDILMSFESFLAELRRLGHTVVPVSAPDLQPDRRMLGAMAEEVLEFHRPFLEAGCDYGEDIASSLAYFRSLPPDEIIEGRRWQELVRRGFEAALDSVDFLLTPTVPVRRKVIGVRDIGSRHHRAVLSYFTAIVNHGLVPALAAPIAGSGSPPASVQVIGRLHDDLSVLALGSELEALGLVRFSRPPMYRAA